jgi:Predicted membrane protein (DUF2142)
VSTRCRGPECASLIRRYACIERTGAGCDGLPLAHLVVSPSNGSGLGVTRQWAQAVPGPAISTPSRQIRKAETSSRGGNVIARIERRPIIPFVWAFVGVGMMLCAWSFATPMAAAPDEPNHIIQAAAVVRGQFDEPHHLTFSGPLSTVRVPEWTQNLPIIPACWLAHLHLPACSGNLGNSTAIVSATTQFSNSPPLYYIVVGVPTLLLSGKSAVYTMRVTGDLLNGALVALGIWLLVRYYPRRTPLIGVLIALSPMVLYLMAVVTTSGFETASGFAAWCGGLCVVEHCKIPRALAICTAVAAVLLVLSRPTSPLDAVILTVVLLLLIGWQSLRQRLNPGLLPLLIPVAVAMVAAGVFLLIDGTPELLGLPPAHPASLLSNMWTTFRLTGGYLRQCIGDFGWVNDPVPTWVVIVWASCLAALTVAALFLSAPCRRALPVLALAVLVLPLFLEAPQINHVGTYFRGRYLVPVAVGFPLVASTFQWPARRHRVAPFVTLVLGVVLIAAQLGSFVGALDFFQTGRGVPTGIHAGWLPPGGQVPVVTVFVIGAIVTLALAVYSMSSRPADTVVR